MKNVIGSVMIVGVLLLSGCQATHLVYVHETTLGVNLAPVPNEGTSKFSFGYDRETYAIVPRIEEGTANEFEAMSLAGVSRIKVTGISALKFGHVVATGQAASKVAMSAETLRAAQEKLIQEQEPGKMAPEK